MSALEPEPEKEVEPQVEAGAEQAQPRGKEAHEARPERGERKERGKGKTRQRNLRESAGYEDDSEGMDYNPFAEAFKGTEWEK